jgi:hypothetical protein
MAFWLEQANIQCCCGHFHLADDAITFLNEDEKLSKVSILVCKELFKSFGLKALLL